MKRARITILMILVGLGLILVVQINAQEEASGINISPLNFELTANPGDVILNKLKIYNPSGSTSIAIEMEVEDFTVVGETGTVKIEPAETETYSLAQWITVEPKNFILEPKEQKFVDFIINVPENAEPGGHYGSVLASRRGVMGEEITGAAVVHKVGSLVLLTVAGEVNESMIVKEFSTPGFTEYGPIEFKIRFENLGSIHVRPKGFIAITNWRDKKVIDIPFPQNNVIPGSVRKVEGSWNKEWLFGKYTAILVGSYGMTNTPFEPSVLTFWVFPWKIMLGVLLILLLITFYFYKTRRRWRLALRILIKGEEI